VQRSHGQPSSPSTFEIWLTYACVAATLAAFAGFASLLVDGAVGRLSVGRPLGLIEASAYAAVVTFLVYGGVVYQVTRLQALKRHGRHRAPARAQLEAIHDEASRSVVVLVPSYKEDIRVIRQTLLSAALQDYPDIEVVLLIDDPPSPATASDRAALEQARALPQQLTELLSTPRRYFDEAFADYARRAGQGAVDSDRESSSLAALYLAAAGWLESAATRIARRDDHAETFFASRVFVEPARELRSIATDLRMQRHSSAAPNARELCSLYRRLTWIFGASITSFERKRY
jgi:hypothetical protein